MRKHLTKLLACVLLSLCHLPFGLSTNAQAQFTRSDQNRISVSDALKKISKSSGTQFVYDLDQLKGKFTSYDIDNIKNKSVEEVLKAILYPNNLVFLYVKEKYYTIVPKDRVGEMNTPAKNPDNDNPPSPVSDVRPGAARQDAAPPIDIKGRVTDSKGDPLLGVSVNVKGTSVGASTDVNGFFSLTAPDANGVLVFTNVGFTPQEYNINNQSTINIQLVQNSTSLGEVVVVGYGSVRKKDLTGSVSSVSSKKLMESATFNTAQALQGRASGVVVQQNDAKPGSDPVVMIRGNRSISATNEPLYVVDGIPLSGGIGEISQSNIESIDILKDASATAIYGSRGANGVVLITTKKGTSGKATIEYNGYQGVQQPAKMVELFNGPEWMDLMREAYRTAGIYPATPNFTSDMTLLPLIQDNDPTGISFKVKNAYDADGNWDPSKLQSTDWIDAVMRTGLISNHEISVRGGTDKIKTYVSGTYYNQKGLVEGQDYSRYSIRVNFDWNITNAITLGGQTNFSHINRKDGPNLFSQTQSLSPLANIRYASGQLVGFVGNDGQLWNPVQNITETIVKFRKDRFLGSYYLDVKLPAGFRFRSNVGLDVGPSYAQAFYGSMSSDRQGAQPRAENGSATSTIFTWENLLFWNKKVKDHTFGVTMLQSIQQEKTESNNISVKDLPYASQLWYNVGSAPSVEAVSSMFRKWQLASFMGRLNYSYKDRYLLTVSSRYDGSSRLSDGNKWVMFPSAALAWRISEEGFFGNVEAINNLKLRVGYGVTGNTAIDPYKTSGNLAINRYNYGTVNVLGFYQNEMPNPDLTWEKTKQWNAGVDIGLFNGRVNGVVDVYLQNTSDLLMARQLPNVSGFSSVVSNIGKTRNKGIEVTINTVNVKTSNFNWSTDFIFSRNKEEIVSLSNGTNDDVGNGWFIGQPLSVYYDYKFMGIWQLGQEAEAAKYGSSFVPGTIRLLDKNGDSRINADDRVILGSPRPKFTASISNYFSYKGFDLNFFLNGSFGNMLNYSRDLRFTGRYNSIKINYWRVTEYDVNGKPVASNGSNEAPRPNKGVEAIPFVSSMGYYNASFVRLSNATVGYNFPQKALEKIHLSRLRMYFSVQNAFVITDYPGTDPESGAAFGVPNPRTFLFGLNVSL